MANQDRVTLSLPQLGAVVAGNALEFYDFLTFSFFAIQIGQVFFPAHNPTVSLLSALATFGVGFATRPFGSLVIGTLGDRLGRKPAMLLSFILMGISIVGLALTPSYHDIGMAAPVLVVMFRLCQGFALGGEVGPVTAFLIEAAPQHRRGLYVSLQQATQYISVLAAGLVGLTLANVMSAQALTQWGWRIAFLIGAAVVPLGLVARSRLPETFRIEMRRRGTATASRLSRDQLILGLRNLSLLGANAISIYIMNYLTTYAVHTLKLPPSVAFRATVVVGLVGTPFTLLGGYLSDRLGRKPVMVGGALLLLAISFPCFMAIIEWRTSFVLLVAAACMAASVGVYSPAILASISEGLPINLRAGSLGIVYALALSCFGGTAQFVVTWLIAATGSPLVPAWYMSGALLVGLTAMVLTRETARRI